MVRKEWISVGLVTVVVASATPTGQHNHISSNCPVRHWKYTLSAIPHRFLTQLQSIHFIFNARKILNRSNHRNKT